MVELLLYFWIFCLACVFCFHGPRVQKLIFSLLWLSTFSLLSLAIRLNFQSDIIVYADSFHNPGIYSYHIREPFFWIGSKLLFVTFRSEVYVFLIYDVISAVILFNALKIYRAPLYIYFSILLFFPVILGMQNVYRQWLATVFLLHAFALARHKNNNAWVFSFVIAVCSHNVAAVMLPALVAYRPKFYVIFYIAALLISVSGVVIGASMSSSSTIGYELGVAYVLLIMIILLLYLASDKWIIRQYNYPRYRVVITLLFLIIICYFHLGVSGIERFGMLSIVLLYPIIGNLINDNYKNSTVLRFSLIVGGTIPIFLVDAKKFILEF